jgi:hypothetical protein
MVVLPSISAHHGGYHVAADATWFLLATNFLSSLKPHISSEDMSEQPPIRSKMNNTQHSPVASKHLHF